MSEAGDTIAAEAPGSLGNKSQLDQALKNLKYLIFLFVITGTISEILMVILLVRPQGFGSTQLAERGWF
ncbi:MAG: hypothetical protein R3B93_17785 [Bacteroidia bacterium]